MWKLAYWILGAVVSSFAIYVADDFFLLSISTIVFSLPLFLIIEAFYIVISSVHKRRIYLVLSWCDLPIICCSIAIWGYIVSINPMGFPCKSLANLIEPAIFTSVACVLYAIRCYHAFKGNLEGMDRWGKISAITVPFTAILLALLFPGLPE